MTACARWLIGDPFVKLPVPHREPLWISRQATDLIHEEQRQAHGGAFGVRDSGAIDSALGRAQARFVYGGGDLAEIAAAYAYGLAKNHGYVDANKRTAWVVCRTFLLINGYRITVSAPELVRAMERLATGDDTEAAFAAWLTGRASPR